MEVKEIKALIALMNEFGLVELEIEDKKGKVRLVRAGANSKRGRCRGRSWRCVRGESPGNHAGEDR